MKEKINNLYQNFLKEIKTVKKVEDLENLRVKYLGRKSGLLTDLMSQLGSLDIQMKKDIGPLVNQIKKEIEDSLASKEKQLKEKELAKFLTKEKIDVTQPVLPNQKRGHLHPTTLVQNDLEDLFTSLGFMVLDGPELESEYYNFTALNISDTHPARDMQDTFYIKNHPDWLMRTQTSPMQVRAMQKYGAPIRAIVPGRCFRNESTDARHEHTLYQIEGLVVDKGINMAHLKGVLEVAAKHLYGSETKVRLRPKFYPFVEPGVNGEVSCFLCQGQGCRVCKKTGWLEIFGAGLVHPAVLKECGIDHKKYQGFAFGFGLDRLVMLKYGIDDIRLLESGDLRFLEQF